jgi:hypothetical protein
MTISQASHAQGPGFEDDVEDEAVPIDGGAGILAAAGIAYAIKRFKDAQKTKTIPADKLK